ncbi:hypothetical protein LINPERPRIM_LOCUS39247, partial [Linum perenne]
ATRGVLCERVKSHLSLRYQRLPLPRYRRLPTILGIAVTNMSRFTRCAIRIGRTTVTSWTTTSSRVTISTVM